MSELSIWIDVDGEGRMAVKARTFATTDAGLRTKSDYLPVDAAATKGLLSDALVAALADNQRLAAERDDARQELGRANDEVAKLATQAEALSRDALVLRRGRGLAALARGAQ